MKRLGRAVALGLIAFSPVCFAALRGTATMTGTQPESKISGTVTFVPASDGLQVSVTVANVPPGKHGIHLHEHADCGDTGKAAGAHFNPDQTPHGFLPKDGLKGAHAGDLGNIEVKADGTGSLTLTLPGLTLTDGPHSVNGRAVILHANPDDFSQPAGNAGGRIGCGVITIGND